MAPKKPTASSTPRRKVRDQYAAVLEEIRSQFKVFGEALMGAREDAASFKAEVRAAFERVDQRFDLVDQRFERVDQRFELMDQRFELMDRRFDRADQRFDLMDRRFDRLEERADGTDSDLGFLRTAVTDHSRELRELRPGLARIEAALDRKVDRDEVQTMIAQGLARR